MALGRNREGRGRYPRNGLLSIYHNSIYQLHKICVVGGRGKSRTQSYYVTEMYFNLHPYDRPAEEGLGKRLDRVFKVLVANPHSSFPQIYTPTAQ